MEIHDFADPNSWYLFHALGVNCRWLAEDPATWNDDPDYKKALEYATSAKVVNDAAERQVYLLILTKRQ
jgi:hypothetical protein